MPLPTHATVCQQVLDARAQLRRKAKLSNSPFFSAQCGLGSTDDKLLDLQRLPLSRVTDQRDGLLRTVGDAHTTAHAGGNVDAGEAIVYRNGRELAIVGTGAARCTQIDIHLCHVPRRGDHGRAVLVGQHRPAATGAAVADGVEPVEHGIFVLVDTIEQVPSL
jgi:hypothetical protein